MNTAEGLIVQGDLIVTGNVDADIPRSSLTMDELKRYPIPLTDWRVWDALEKPLPGPGNLEAGVIPVSFVYGEATPLDAPFFVAVGRRYRVLGIIVRPLVVGSDGGAVTAEIRKAPSGTAIASGTLLHSGTADLKGAINTNQTLTLSATSSALDIAIGDCIGIDTTGTMTAARGVITVLLAPSPSADDLMLVGGTFGSGASFIRSIDVKALGALTLRMRNPTVRIPAEYVAGETLRLVMVGGMITTIADVSCTVDVEAWKVDEDGTLGSADLVSTAAMSINSLTFAEKAFDVTATTLGPGDLLDVRVSIAVNDAAAVTAVIAALAATHLDADVKG